MKLLVAALFGISLGSSNIDTVKSFSPDKNQRWNMEQVAEGMNHCSEKLWEEVTTDNNVEVVFTCKVDPRIIQSVNDVMLARLKKDAIRVEKEATSQAQRVTVKVEEVMAQLNKHNPEEDVALFDKWAPKAVALLENHPNELIYFRNNINGDVQHYDAETIAKYPEYKFLNDVADINEGSKGVVHVGSIYQSYLVYQNYDRVLKELRPEGMSGVNDYIKTLEDDANQIADRLNTARNFVQDPATKLEGMTYEYRFLVIDNKVQLLRLFVGAQTGLGQYRVYDKTPGLSDEMMSSLQMGLLSPNNVPGDVEFFGTYRAAIKHFRGGTALKDWTTK